MQHDSTHVDVERGDLDLTEEGGAWLALEPGVRSATVRCPELTAIDLVSSPDLEQIDLTECAEGLAFTMSSCPKLERLVLPSTGPGAVLHLAFGPRLPGLFAHGRIADVDLCWMDEDHPPPGPGLWGADAGLGPLRGRERRAPLCGLAITRAGSAIPDDVEFVVLVAGDAETLVLPPRVREAMIADARALRSVRLAERARLAAVEFGSLPALEELVGRARVQHLRVEDAPKITCIDWGGRRATIVRSGDSALMVDASFSEILLGESEAQELDARFVDELHLRGCSALRRVVVAPEGRVAVSGHSEIEEFDGPASLEVEEVTLRQIVRGAFQADEGLRAAVLDWLGRRHGRSGFLDAVQILHACSTRGWSLPQLWEQRCALHARACGQRDDGQRWSWVFPRDLADRGWEADLQLWRRCRDEARATSSRSFEGPTWTEPVEYRFALAASSEPHHLLALATAAWRLADAAEPTGDLVDLLVEALEHGATRGKPLVDSIGSVREADGVPARVFDRLKGVVRALVGLREEPGGAQAMALFCLWIGRRLPNDQGLDLLGALRDLGSPDATEVLATFAADPKDPARRRRALALLMKPPTHAVLAATGATT